MISIKDFSFKFKGSKERILDDVTLEISPGEFMLVTGPSGCGKSTLSLCIAGFSRELGEPEGSILVDGKNVIDGNVFESSSLVGIVQQDPESQLVALTVEEEVSFGPENLNLSHDEIEERIGWGLKMAKADHLRKRATYELSGGEKQKIALASMLAMRPKVLIFDEPTSNLDPVATKEIFDSIISLKRDTDMTIVVMEHKLQSLIRYADSMIRMEDGRITASGSPDEVLSTKDLKEYGMCSPLKGEAKDLEMRYGSVILEIDDISFSYGDRDVLKEVSFKAREGEMICIMGENGSGKTTFLYTILGFLRPDEGSVRVMGKEVRKNSISSNARNVGLVFQNPNHQIFEDSVEKEIQFAARNFDVRPPDTGEFLERFKLPVDKDKKPFKLSFGQKRRLNVASVCSYGPKILMLDEPFIGQDFKNATNLVQILDDIRDDDNLIMFVSHDPRMISQYCTRIVFFEDGRIIYDDSPENVFNMMERDNRNEFIPKGMGECT
ncbi:MAG TPA: ATP-binding cassette domain-containing protein [Candidatus Methanofastidiosa archaeon]|nr:ATP-binding cassette domain-containing protein [Candidatus Methanofastidiosa archaeon]